MLAVDDPDLLLALQATFVRRAGCRLLTAVDPDEALAKARAGRPDLVILDADGWGAEGCRRMKLDAQLAATPVILVASDPRLARRTVPAVEAVVSKPVEATALLDAMRRLVSIPERAGSRRRASLPVTYYRGEEQGRGYTKDLSVDGLFLKVAAPPAVGEGLRVVFDLPGESEPTIRATARVMRAVAPQRDSHLLAGVGLRLLDVGERDREGLARFVASGA